MAVKAMERLFVNWCQIVQRKHVEGGGGACKKDAGGTLGSDRLSRWQRVKTKQLRSSPKESKITQVRTGLPK